MAEIRPHTIRHRSDAFHARTRLLEKCGGGPGNRPGAYRRFQIPVQILVGVEFRRVRRQVKELDLLGVFGSPLADTVGAVHAQVVDDQEHLTPRILNQVFQEHDEALGIDGALEEREAHQALVGDRRDHRCRPMATGRQSKLRRQPRHRVTSHPVRVLPNGGLVTPVDLGILSLGARNDLRILVLKPCLEPGRVLLERALDRSLRREAPPPKVFTDGTNRHVDAEELLDGEHDRATIPQRELELQLGGVRADDLQTQLLLLNQRQCSSRPRAPTTLPALDDSVEVVSLGAPRPFQNGPNMNPTHFSNVRPCVALLAQYKCLATNVFQGFGRKLAGIDLFHARIISKPI
ncbi:protein of unknown function [Thauera humireducens]|nr:protein of unknown function [Thauera humireducens]